MCSLTVCDISLLWVNHFSCCVLDYDWLQSRGRPLWMCSSQRLQRGRTGKCRDPVQHLYQCKLKIRMAILAYSKNSVSLHVRGRWISCHALSPLYACTLSISILTYRHCSARDAFISQRSLRRPRGNIRSEAFKSSHEDSGCARSAVTGQVHPPTYKNVNYLIRFGETASERRRVQGPVRGTQSVGGRAGKAVLLSTEPFDPWFLLLISHWNSTWRGREQDWTVLFSPPLTLSIALGFISLFHTFSAQCYL